MTSPTPAALWQNPRTASLVTLSLVFLVGILVGAVIHDMLHNPAVTPVNISESRLAKELDLTPAQREQVHTILGDFSRYYQDVMLTGKGSIYRILNDDQKRKFEKMLEDARR